MPNPLSLGIRRRFQKLYEQGLSAREAGRRLMISAATSARFGKKLREGAPLVPAENRRSRGKGRLAPYESFFEELVSQDPDITLRELRGALEDAHGGRPTTTRRGPIQPSAIRRPERSPRTFSPQPTAALRHLTAPRICRLLHLRQSAYQPKGLRFRLGESSVAGQSLRSRHRVWETGFSAETKIRARTGPIGVARNYAENA